MKGEEPTGGRGGERQRWRGEKGVHLGMGLIKKVRGPLIPIWEQWSMWEKGIGTTAHQL